MKPDANASDEEPAVTQDALDQLLKALPSGDLDAARAERLRRRAHAELRRATTPSSSRALLACEPLLLTVCAACALTRFVLALLFLWRSAL